MHGCMDPCAYPQAEAYYVSNWEQLRELFPEGTTLDQARETMSSQFTSVAAAGFTTVALLLLGLAGSGSFITPQSAGAMIVGIMNFLALPIAISVLFWGGYFSAYASP